MQYPKAQQPFHCVHIDIEDIPTQQDGTVYVFFCVDEFSTMALGTEVKKTTTPDDYIDVINKCVIKHPKRHIHQTETILFLDIDKKHEKYLSEKLPGIKTFFFDRNKTLLHTLPLRISFYKGGAAK